MPLRMIAWNILLRTAQSTTEITGMVSTIPDETQRAVETMQVCRDQAERGVALATRAGKSLEKINGGADHTRRMAGEIVMATREQSKTGADTHLRPSTNL